MRRPRAALPSFAVPALAAVLALLVASVPSCAASPSTRVQPEPAPSLRSPQAIPGAVLIESGRPGPRVAVVGGIHGDETSGIALAEALPSRLSGRLTRGSVLVVAVANPLAASSRSGPSGLDLNRLFPAGDREDNPEAARARELFAILRGCDLVVDLHEEGLAWLESDRPTLVTNARSAAVALSALEGSDRPGNGLSNAGFAFTGGAPRGSLNHELGLVGTAAVTVEVPARLALHERLRLQSLAVTALIAAMGILAQ
ncbi:MAG: succinylglutamate desuccinylase/aspartoacylase family protein [Spirochaetota bacterium]